VITPATHSCLVNSAMVIRLKIEVYCATFEPTYVPCDESTNNNRYNGQDIRSDFVITNEFNANNNQQIAND